VDSPLPFGALCAFLTAALPEEFFKYRVLTKYSACQLAFNEPMDGVVYGVATALGFAVLENLRYGLAAGWDVVVLRAFTALPGHACWGAIMGYYVGQACCNSQWLISPWRGFVVAVLLHGLYDFPLFSLKKLAAQWPQGGEDLTQAAWVWGMVGAAGLVNVGSWVWTIVIVHRLRREQERAETPETSDSPISGGVLSDSGVACQGHCQLVEHPICVAKLRHEHRSPSQPL
jgi:hypothetical protein